MNYDELISLSTIQTFILSAALPLEQVSYEYMKEITDEEDKRVDLCADAWMQICLVTISFNAFWRREACGTEKANPGCRFYFVHGLIHLEAH